MKKFGYKNYLTKSLIKENMDTETHNKIVLDFLSTMRHGQLPVKNKENGMLVQQDDTHTSFFIERRQQVNYYYKMRGDEYIHNYTYMVYTLSYDTNHTTCKFDIEEKLFFNKTYSELLKEINGEWLPYKDVDDFCLKLVNKLGLIKQDVSEPNKDTISNSFDNQLAKEIYNKSTRLQEINVEKSEDNTGVQSPKFQKKKGVQFKVQDMIGDNMFRHINAVKQKAEASLINWQKTAYTNNQENENTIACDILHVTLENSVTDNANKKINLTKDDLGSKYDIDLSKVDTHEITKLLSVYPPELLSPIVFLSMDKSIKWGKEGNKTSKEILNYIFGDDNVFKSGLISYDDSVSGELIDSEVAINSENGYKKIGISTKGGLNGQGAQASLISVFRLLFDKETREYNPKKDTYKARGHIFSNDIKTIIRSDDVEENIESFIRTNCSKYGIEMFEKAKTEISIILLFGGLTPAVHETLIKIIEQRGKLFDMKLELEGTHNIVTEFCNFVNQNFNVTNIIMEILNKQKYDFAQINALPVMNGSSFNYEWSVQYPAHFDGNVKLEKRARGVGFHIHGA